MRALVTGATNGNGTSGKRMGWRVGAAVANAFGCGVGLLAVALLLWELLLVGSASGDAGADSENNRNAAWNGNRTITVVALLAACLVGGPAGAATRHALVKRYGKLGTVLSNLAAVALLSLFHVLVASSVFVFGTPKVVTVLNGLVATGFCGALSTVSSFLADCAALREATAKQKVKEKEEEN